MSLYWLSLSFFIVLSPPHIEAGKSTILHRSELFSPFIAKDGFGFLSIQFRYRCRVESCLDNRQFLVECL